MAAGRERLLHTQEVAGSKPAPPTTTSFQVSKLTMVPGTAAGPLGTLVEDYLAACTAGGLAPHTLQNSCGYPLRKVLLPCSERQRITEPAAITNRALDRLSRELLDDGGLRGPLSRHSVHAYV